MLVKSAKHAVQSSIGVGAGLAAGALSGLPVTTFEAPAISSNPAGGVVLGDELCGCSNELAVSNLKMWPRFGRGCTRCNSSLLILLKLNHCFVLVQRASLEVFHVASDACYSSLLCPVQVAASASPSTVLQLLRSPSLLAALSTASTSQNWVLHASSALTQRSPRASKASAARQLATMRRRLKSGEV